MSLFLPFLVRPDPPFRAAVQECGSEEHGCGDQQGAHPGADAGAFRNGSDHAAAETSHENRDPKEGI